MRSVGTVWLPLAAVALTLAVLICTCITPSGDATDPFWSAGNGDDQTCNISTDGMKDQPFVAQCFDPYGQGNVISVTGVRGTTAELEDGERFVIAGEFTFAQMTNGKIEPTIGCQAGANYGKCSWPFTKKSGSFELRLAVSGCDEIAKPNQITLNVWDSAANVSAAMCVVYLGEAPTDDDTADDDIADDDTTDDDLSDDDLADDDLADDDTTRSPSRA